MIRFVEIGEIEGFAFFNTVYDTFVMLEGVEAWSSEDEFLDSAARSSLDQDFIIRCHRLIPEKWRKDG